MLSSVSTFVLTSLSLVLVTADNSMPMPFELSIADDRVEACRHPSKKAPEKATTSNTSLCFAGLKEGTDGRLHWRAMSTSLHLKNMTLLIKMKVRRLLIFSPGASIRMAGGDSVPVFGIMKELELASNFNGYGMVSGATNSSAIFEGQLNSTLFEGHIIYQNLSRSHTIQCFHSNTLKPDFYQSDSCIRCIVFTYDTRRHRASPVGWRSSNLPLCQNNGTSTTAPGHQDIAYARLHSSRSTEGDENEEEDSSGFPKTGFSDYRMDVSHRATEIHSAPDQGMSVNAVTAKRNSEGLEATAEPPVNEVMHAEAKDQPGHPNTGERSSENGKNKSHSGYFALYPSVKISDDENTKGIEPPGDRDNTPEQETIAGASEEKETGYVSDQLSSEVRNLYGRNNRSAKGLEPGAENGTGQSTQSPERRQLGSSPEASKAETSIGDGVRLLRLAQFTKKERLFSSQSDTQPDIKSSRKASSATQIPPRTAYSTKWKYSRKQYPAGQSSSIRQLSTSGNSLNSLRKPEPAYQNARTSRKQRSTNPNPTRNQDSTTEDTYPNFSRKQRSTTKNTSRKRRSTNPSSSSKQGSTNEDTLRKRRPTSQNSSKKQRSTNEDTSRKRRSTNPSSSKKQGSTNEDTSRKRRPANQNFARRTRRSTGQSGTHSSDDSSFLETVSCSLHLVADHLFFNEMGDSSTAKTVNLMLSVVIGADAVFRATDFDGDGVRDNIGFQVKNITIIHNSSAAFYGYSRTNGNSFQYLRSFSTADFSDVCLGVAFTAIDFDRGVVGLAWYASSLSGGAGKGGICGQRVYLPNEGSSFSFNTAIVTFLNHGSSVSMEKAILTMAHEFGHCFGSSHDDMEGSACNRQYAQGSYLMQKYRPSQYFPNNYKFSPCSLRQMYPVIARKGGCMTRYIGPTCGNGVLEEGEECDCGLSGACRFNDPCCTPGDAPPSSDDPPCTVRRSQGMDCSPVTFPCCSQSCRHVGPEERYVCRDASDCYSQARCDGQGPLCPASTLRPDGTPCHSGVRACSQGRCRQSMCVMAGLDDCFCAEGVEDRCKLCCRHPQTSACLPAVAFNITSSSGGVIFLAEGDGCLNYRGVCTSSSSGSGEKKRLCVTVDSLAGDFSALVGLERDSESGAKAWLYNTWFYLLLIPLVPVLASAAILRGPRLWGKCQGWPPQENSANTNARLLGLIAVAQSRSETFRVEADRASAAFDRVCSRLEHQHRLQRQPQRGLDGQPPGAPQRRYSDRIPEGSHGSYSFRSARRASLPRSRSLTRVRSPARSESPPRRQFRGDLPRARSPRGLACPRDRSGTSLPLRCADRRPRPDTSPGFQRQSPRPPPSDSRSDHDLYRHRRAQEHVSRSAGHGCLGAAQPQSGFRTCSPGPSGRLAQRSDGSTLVAAVGTARGGSETVRHVSPTVKDLQQANTRRDPGASQREVSTGGQCEDLSSSSGSDTQWTNRP